jgi:predicted dehydrogenase
MLREGRAEPDFAVGTGIHAVDTVLSFLGRPERVRARREAADKGWALFEADVFSRGGASARVTIRPQCRWDAELYRLLAPTYAATMDVFECRVVITDTEGPILDWSAPAGAPESFRNGTVGETEAFLRALKGERPFAPTLQDGLAAMQVAEAMQNGVQDVCLP